MQNLDNPTGMSPPESQEESLGQNVPSFPFLTKLWLNGNTIAIVLGLLAVVGSGSIFGIKTGNGLGTFLGMLIGAIYGVIIWFSIRLYSEIAGVWLNMEESTRITADILLRKEAKEVAADAGKEIKERN